MAFFVTSNEESGKAGRVLRAPALFLLALIGGGDAATAARCLSPPPPPSPPTASSPSAAAGAFRRDARPSPFERHDASRDPRDADHRKSCAFRPHSAPSLRFFYRSPLPLPLAATSAIQPGCIDVSNLSARDAARAAAIANCIDARRLDAARSNSWHNSHTGCSSITALYE